MKIVVRIDRLVLDGLPVERRDRAALEAALRTELTARFLATDVPQPVAGLHVNRVVADPARLSNPGSGANVGAAIGRSVHGAIGRGGRA